MATSSKTIDDRPSLTEPASEAQPWNLDPRTKDWLTRIEANERCISETKSQILRLEAKVQQLTELLHRRDADEEYMSMIRRIRAVVDIALPAEATILVISKGDGHLLNLQGRQAWHFPQVEGGVYAGCYPADSIEATNHLEQLRSRGANYLLIPATAFWWLDSYADWKQHLDRYYRVISYQAQLCILYSLEAAPSLQ